MKTKAVKKKGSVPFAPDEIQSAMIAETPPSLSLPSIHEIGAFAAKTHLSALLEKVAHGHTFIITKHGKPVAELKPVQAKPKTRELGWAKGKGFWMAPDFDAPLEDFADYM